MKDSVTVYWANIPDDDLDWAIIFEEPVPLINELALNKNKNNLDNNLLRCPAVIDLIKNTFIIKNPLESYGSFIIEDGMVSREMHSKDNKWVVNRPPSFNNQLLAMYRHPIMFFCEEEIDIMMTEPYFSKAQHKSWGSIVPGMFNCGSWFRPIQIEFNIWENTKDLHLEQDEPLAYVKFMTNKKIVFKRFAMTDSLISQAKICSSAGRWEPKVPLVKRYKRFKNTKRNKFVIEEIKKNLL